MKYFLLALLLVGCGHDKPQEPVVLKLKPPECAPGYTHRIYRAVYLSKQMHLDRVWLRGECTECEIKNMRERFYTIYNVGDGTCFIGWVN